MQQFHNLLVDLDQRFSDDAVAMHRRNLEAAGFSVSVTDTVDERTLSWIDLVFGGAWSSEAFDASNIVVRCGDAPAGFATFAPRAPRYAWLRKLGAAPDVGVFGPFGVDPAMRGLVAGPAMLNLAMNALRKRGFRRGLIAAVGEDRLVSYYARNVGATVAETFSPFAFAENPVRTVVLASGSGSNFQAIVQAVGSGVPLCIDALVTNRSDAFAIERAKIAQVQTRVVAWDRGAQTRDAYDERLLREVSALDPQLVLLLGWMHLLAPAFVRAFPATINIHPGFLPLEPSRDSVGFPDGSTSAVYRGAHAVRDALAEGRTWVGASAHHVTDETDRGKVLARRPLAFESGASEGEVMARLHPLEHGVITTAVRRWLFER